MANNYNTLDNNNQAFIIKKIVKKEIKSMEQAKKEFTSDYISLSLRLRHFEYEASFYTNLTPIEKQLLIKQLTRNLNRELFNYKLPLDGLERVENLTV